MSEPYDINRELDAAEDAADERQAAADDAQAELGRPFTAAEWDAFDTSRQDDDGLEL